MEKSLNLFTDLHHSNLNEKSGIYQLMLENHLYVGSSVNLYYRLKRHVSNLRKKNHQNRFVQNCFNKYGEENTFFRILEFCEKEVLKTREKYWIDFLNPDTNNERDPVERIFRQESIDQIIATLKNGYATGRIKSMTEKPINQYSVYGQYIRSFKSAVEAGDILGFNCQKISRAARRSKWGYTAFGYKWKYKESKNDTDNLPPTERRAMLSAFYKLKLTAEDGSIVILKNSNDLKKYLVDMVNANNKKFTIELITVLNKN